MKKVIIVLALLAMATPSFAKIDSGEGHDFGTLTGDNDFSEASCTPCHYPHIQGLTGQDADLVALVPMWGHAETAITDFSVYTDGETTDDQYPAVSDLTAATLTPETKMCMSCHDGTVDLDNFGGTDRGDTKMTGIRKFVAADMATKSHPVEIDYDNSVGVTGYKDAPGAGNLSFNTDGGGNTMTCMTCHDPHDGVDDDGTYLAFSSASLCAECHSK